MSLGFFRLWVTLSPRNPLNYSCILIHITWTLSPPSPPFSQPPRMFQYPETTTMGVREATPTVLSHEMSLFHIVNWRRLTYFHHHHHSSLTGMISILTLFGNSKQTLSKHLFSTFSGTQLPHIQQQQANAFFLQSFSTSLGLSSRTFRLHFLFC